MKPYERKELRIADITRTLTIAYCPYCDHEWEPRKDILPKQCPACKRYFK